MSNLYMCFKINNMFIFLMQASTAISFYVLILTFTFNVYPFCTRPNLQYTGNSRFLTIFIFMMRCRHNACATFIYYLHKIVHYVINYVHVESNSMTSTRNETGFFFILKTFDCKFKQTHFYVWKQCFSCFNKKLSEWIFHVKIKISSRFVNNGVCRYTI